jgi:hypothetical protein
MLIRDRAGRIAEKQVIFGHKEAQKIASGRCTLRRAYRRAGVVAGTPDTFVHFCGQPDWLLWMRIRPRSHSPTTERGRIAAGDRPLSARSETALTEKQTPGKKTSFSIKWRSHLSRSGRAKPAHRSPHRSRSYRKESCLGCLAACFAASSSGEALRCRGGRETRWATAASRSVTMRSQICLMCIRSQCQVVLPSV